MTKTDEFRQANTRPAYALRVGGFRPSLHPLATNLCRHPVGLPGEEWPSGAAGPLAFVGQLNLTAAPAVPELLRDVALLTFFVSLDLASAGRENGDNWQLRTYTSLDNLTPLPRPAAAPKLGKAFECEWEVVDDHPNHDDPELVKVPGARRPSARFDNVVRTKAGGYASTIQSEPWWGFEAHPCQPRYALQFNSEEKAGLAWGDGGTIYIARGTAAGCQDRWFLDWQTL